jgi:hypothetical protein
MKNYATIEVPVKVSHPDKPEHTFMVSIDDPIFKNGQLVEFYWHISEKELWHLCHHYSDEESDKLLREEILGDLKSIMDGPKGTMIVKSYLENRDEF